MSKYRKKPVEIEAMQWDGTPSSAGEIIDWCIYGGLTRVQDSVPSYYETNETLHRKHPELRIVTLEGVMTAAPQDWIIRGVNDEIYPCKPDIFEKTYEAVKPVEFPPAEGRYATVWLGDINWHMSAENLIGRAEVMDGKIVIEPVSTNGGKDLSFNIDNDHLIEIVVQSTRWKRKEM